VFKGEVMRKQYMRILFVLVGLTGLGMAAQGQPVDQISVKIPYEFVVQGQTLPAGTYRVSRATNTNERILVLSSFENRASVALLPSQIQSSSTGKTLVSFIEVGGQYFLSKIETADHAFGFSVSQKEILEAEARRHSGSSASGSASGSN
jgi:hypothetical protein